MSRVTLKELAGQYHRNPTTFRKYVIELGIPHIKLGRDMLFDPVKVELFLGARTEDVEPVKLPRLKPAESKYNTRSEFAGALG